MNFGKAFSYIFEDPEWIKKILIVALVSLIPIVGQIAALGFALEVMRRVINNDPHPLPQFDFGDFLGKGFKGFIVSLVYAIPLLILMLPIQAAGIIAENNANQELMNIIFIVVSCICGGLFFIYAILFELLLPAAYGKLVTEGTIGAAFKFKEVFALLRKGIVPFLIAFLATIVAGIIAPFGLIVCLIGVLVTQVYYFAVMGHIYGQAYKQAVEI